MPPIRIASAQGYWGDWPQAPAMQVRSGPIDYLVFDYLAEVTMSILQKQRRRDPARGYAFDFCDVVESILPEVIGKGVAVISNAGGVNPIGCAKELLARIKKTAPDSKIRVGVVHGDDVMDRIKTLTLRGLDPASPALADIKAQLISANIYFGAQPVAELLADGCQIVVTGRVTDTGLTLAPMIQRFGIEAGDWDAMATGIVAGHILECGAQSSGGNFLGGRMTNDQLVNVGFPIAETSGPGDLVITKHESLGGMVSMATVKEQLLYEIGDPTNYITPDVIADFSSIRLADEGPNRVRVSGIKGRPPTSSYKVSCAYSDGYLLFGTMVYTWPDAIGKARQAGELIRERAKILGLKIEDFRLETVGYDACHGAIASAAGSAPSEVQLRLGVRSHDEKSLSRFGQEIVPLVLTGPPGATGFAGGRPKPTEVLAYWPGLVEKTEVAPKTEILTIADL